MEISYRTNFYPAFTWERTLTRVERRRPTKSRDSGGKKKLGGVSKRDDKYIRRLLFGGAIAVIRHARGRATAEGEWVRAMLARKPAKVVAAGARQPNRPYRLGGDDARRGLSTREKFVGRAA